MAKSPRNVLSWLILALVACSRVSVAREMTVTVLDRNDEPVPNVAVYVDAPESGDSPAGAITAVMDQVNTQFVPHLLVIQKGTRVEFPNSDPVAHHVYSFSRPNDFMLPLYKGDAHAPVTFEQPGVVTLGCNIHDSMLAYILVVDGSRFGKTDVNGRVSLDVEGMTDGSVTIWSPRIRQRGEVLTRPVREGAVEFRIKGRLRAAHDSESGGIEWTDY